MQAANIESRDIVDLFNKISSRQGLSSPSTVLNYASQLSAVFTVARTAWNIPLDKSAMEDAMIAGKKLGILAKSQHRDRRPAFEELDKVLCHFEEAKARAPQSTPMHAISVFALFSTRRQEEITRFTWADLDADKSRVLIRDRKHPGQKAGNDVWCDLPSPALGIALSMPRKNSDDRVFPYNAETISSRCTRACKFLGIEDLRFHDLRREGNQRECPIFCV